MNSTPFSLATQARQLLDHLLSVGSLISLILFESHKHFEAVDISCSNNIFLIENSCSKFAYCRLVLEA